MVVLAPHSLEPSAHSYKPSIRSPQNTSWLSPSTPAPLSCESGVPVVSSHLTWGRFSQADCRMRNIAHDVLLMPSALVCQFRSFAPSSTCVLSSGLSRCAPAGTSSFRLLGLRSGEYMDGHFCFPGSHHSESSARLPAKLGLFAQMTWLQHTSLVYTCALVQH